MAPARAYVVVWIAAWASSAAVFGDGVVGKVTKCCPRDMILMIDMSTCTEYVGHDQNARQSYVWATDDDDGDGDGDGDEDDDKDTAAASDKATTLFLANSSTVPWWIPYDMQFLRAANLSAAFEPDGGSFFDADGRLPCGADDREVAIIDDDVAVLDDGRLIAFGHGDRSEDGYGRLTFAGAEYCVDRVSLLDKSTKSGGGGGLNSHRNATAATAAYTYVTLVCRPCSRITCVPKCCAKGFMLEYKKDNITGCRKAESVADANAAIRLKAANGTELRRDDYYFFGMKPPDCGARNWYILDKSSGVGYGLLPDGRVQVDNGVAPIERDEYCVDAMNVVVPPVAQQQQQRRTYTDVLIACRLGGLSSVGGGGDDGRLEFRQVLYGAYFVVGDAFLAATLLIYATLPELRVTVHSGNLIAHTVCLFVSYAALAATTLVRRAFDNFSCVVAGFVIQFSFLAAFFWLNVMCADIAWTFSGFRLLLYSNKIENEKKKYIIYSVYAWGCSIAITLLTALAEFTKSLGDHKYKPNFGHKVCWFSNKLSVGVFFYLPIGLLLLTNFILFLFTAFRIVFIRRDTSKVLNRQNNKNNMRLSLYLKLFCLMGVTFVFEVISWWAVDAPAYYWYATDAVNSLRGVFVFFIFCWKRPVLNLLLARAPESARRRFVRAFGIVEPRTRYPSFSSTSQQPNHFGGASAGAGAHNNGPADARARGSSFQLSLFGGPTALSARQAPGRRSTGTTAA